MDEMLADYKNEWEDQLNIPLMNKEGDIPLIDCILGSFESLEVIPQLKMIGYNYVDNPSKTEINSYIYKREKKKKKKDRFNVKLKSDNLVGKLTINFEATIREEDPKTRETKITMYPITKTMLVPLQDEQGYFHLKGKRFSLIYQMLEKSTYTSSNSVTLKSLMPVAVKRYGTHVKDIYDNEYIVPYYKTYVFRKEIPVILFYLSNGIEWCLDFLHCSEIIEFLDKIPKELDEDFIYFELSPKCYMKVFKDSFEKYTYIKSVVGMFSNISTNRLTVASLDDRELWIKKIANPANLEKGMVILRFFNRMLDKNTQRDLRLAPYYKKDIYRIILWMITHYNELRLKDNCDLKNKRLRCNECISALLDKEFSKRLSRIISKGEKISLNDLSELFKFSGELLIQKMHAGGLLRYDDSVNDMSVWKKLKTTNKGIHSLGNGNSNNIGVRYRAIHPSHLGNLDILVCGNSDPGTSSIISPFAKIDGLYFDGSDEPMDFFYNLRNDLKEYYKRKGIAYIGISFDSAKDYYDALYALEEFNDENFKTYGTSIDGEYEIIIGDEIDIDKNTKQIGDHNSENKILDKQNNNNS